jgi:malonyl-CoA O-methyltransferase
VSAPPPSASRPIDRIAVERIVRRLATHAEAPWLHAEVARRMSERLSVIRKQPATVIEWSGHLGASDEVLRTAYPKARRIVVEPHAVLQATTEMARKPGWWSRLSGGRAEVLTPERVPAATGELLWANMMLQGSGDPPALLIEWHRELAVDGFLMFSTLGPGSLVELSTLYRDLGWPPPLAPFVDMHDLGDMLVHAGFADPVMDQEVLTLSWPSAGALLAELRTLGGNAHPQRPAGLRTPRWRARLHDALQARADAQGRIRLSFEVVYGHAFRAPTRAKVQPETAVSVDAMREMMRSGRRGLR